MRTLTALTILAAIGVAPSAGANDLSHPLYANKKDAKSLTAYAPKLIADDHCTAAIPFLQMAIEVDPAYAEAYLDLGIAYADGGRDDKALQAYERYPALRP